MGYMKRAIPGKNFRTEVIVFKRPLDLKKTLFIWFLRKMRGGDGEVSSLTLVDLLTLLVKLIFIRTYNLGKLINRNGCLLILASYYMAQY